VEPPIYLGLRDDGIAPDVRANDSVWTIQVDVPVEAPTGEFLVHFRAYGADGEMITTRAKNEEPKPLIRTLPVLIQ
jgi:hypothetical protein